jgi:hypothetical protein
MASAKLKNEEPLFPPEPELPRSMCPVCGSLDVQISDGRGYCQNELCRAEMTFRIEVEAWPDTEISEVNGQAFPIIKYKDIVGDIKNRFKLLDL